MRSFQSLPSPSVTTEPIQVSSSMVQVGLYVQQLALFQTRKCKGCTNTNRSVRCASPYLTCRIIGINFLFRSVNLILFTLLLVQHTSPHHSPCLRSHHLSVPLVPQILSSIFFLVSLRLPFRVTGNKYHG